MYTIEVELTRAGQIEILKFKDEDELHDWWWADDTDVGEVDHMSVFVVGRYEIWDPEETLFKTVD